MKEKPPKFIEENPHYQELSSEQLLNRDRISYLSLDKDFKLKKKSINFKNNKDVKKQSK